MTDDKQDGSERGITQSSIPFLPRLFLFLEIIIVLFMNFIVYIILTMLVPIDPETTNVAELIIFYYVEPALSILIGSLLGLIIIETIFQDRETYPSPKKVKAIKDVFSTLKINKQNYKFQIIYGILFLYLVFIPLDFIAYSIPGVMDFSLRSFEGTSTETILSLPLIGPFLGSAIVMYICVGFREELFFRSVSISRGRRHVGNYSSVLLFSIAFGLSHLAYIITSDNILADLLPAFVWGISAFIVGLATGLFLMKKRYVLPLMFAHTLNNVISSTALWLFGTKNISFPNIALYFYMPLLIISLVLAIVFRSHVKSGLKSFFQIFKDYGKESGDHKIFVLLMDLALGLTIFFVSLFLF